MSGCLKPDKVPGNGLFHTLDVEQAVSFRGEAPNPHQERCLLTLVGATKKNSHFQALSSIPVYALPLLTFSFICSFLFARCQVHPAHPSLCPTSNLYLVTCVSPRCFSRQLLSTNVIHCTISQTVVFTGSEKKRRLWRTCGEKRPDTLLLQETEIHVHFHAAGFSADRLVGFRVLYSFFQVECAFFTY